MIDEIGFNKDFDKIGESICYLVYFLISVYLIFSLPSADIDKEISLKLFFLLVLIGNIYFLVVLGILYALYYVEAYNPWCSKVWHKFLIPEKVMNSFHYCAIALFTGATLPVTIAFVLKNFR